MKVDRNRLKKSTSEVPAECQNLIDKLKSCTRAELLEELSQVETWTFGKCELFHWIDVLDIFDTILEDATEVVPENRWALACDVTYSIEDKKLLLWTLHFTTLLIEHSFSRHLYNSMEHLINLLSSSDMQVVLGVLNLLYMFSKRSNFITRLNTDKRQALLSRLHYLAESWGGKENGFGLADCCNPEKLVPASATTLHFEFYSDSAESISKTGKTPVNCIHLENIDKMEQAPAEIMRTLVNMYTIPQEKEMLLFTHVRLAHRFSDYKSRLFCVQARLQALSVLVYSNALQDNAHMLLYNGLLEELVELLELQLPYLVEIRSAALRTLTSIIHLDRNPHFPKKPGSRLSMIIDVTGANLYHGFLPVLVRNCISSLTQCRSQSSLQPEEQASCSSSQNLLSNQNVFPLPLATALFSFLYHLASYEAGGDALVNCGMMESLLNVINWHGNELEHITFVTRAVRVIDLITNIDMNSFQNHGGLSSFINRLDVEVNLCKKEQPFEIPVKASVSDEVAVINDGDEEAQVTVDYSNVNNGRTCLPQRAALLKSMLNFLKKALQDPTFSDSIRHVMEGTLPSSLKHIISNAEYYGPSLFLLATDVVTVYVFQEPSLLSALQENGLTDVVLQALLIKEVPATREVLGSLPNVFSALCLNARGLSSFVKCKPFERLFKVLLSPTYLPAMRRRRTTDPLGDTASNLGNAMDELMRHQPSLKVDATAAIIKLLQELCQLGTDSKYVCQRAHNKNDIISPSVARPASTNEAGSSDEDDEEEEESTSSHTNRDDNSQESNTTQIHSEKTPIVLVDYILNVMKFVDAILSNNSTDDHCREFVNQGGLSHLLKILALPNLPVDCPITAASQAVASVCKSILSLAHEPKVLKQGLTQLSDILQLLKPLCSNINKPSGSILLHELASAPNLETAFSNPAATPLLHAMNAAHGYVIMFVHVCRTGQSEIRTLSLQHWGSEEGMQVLNVLAELYTSLVWESTLLLALCSEDIIPLNCQFSKDDMDRLNMKPNETDNNSSDGQNSGTSGMTTAMQSLSTNAEPSGAMDVDVEPKTQLIVPSNQQLKYIRPLLGASSRLGRALAELFGLLVKLCVGTPIRQRRGQNFVTTPPYPGPFARSVATALNCLLASGLNWEKLPPSPIPKFRLTFLICSVGFTSPMLFDEKKYPYHLMLQRFVTLGGQETFFRTFHWALSAGGKLDVETAIESPDLPEGTGEFLDAWLMLLEKMVNPKTILETPHVISNKGTVRGIKNCPFDPVKYLVQIHKIAFDAIKLIWGKKPLNNYGNRMTESILAIIKHIICGEKILKERLNKADESVEVREQEGEIALLVNEVVLNIDELIGVPDVNYDHLYQLLDMGFAYDQCREALLNTSSMEQATDYLLNNPPQARESSSADSVAIATSSGTCSKSAKKTKEDECTMIPEADIDDFIKCLIPNCLSAIDVLPDTVYRVCDVLITIIKRNGSIYRNNLLQTLLTEIHENVGILLFEFETTLPTKFITFMTESKPANKLAVRLHLYTLLFEGPTSQEMRISCTQAVHKSGYLPTFVRLLNDCQTVLQYSDYFTIKMPKWLSPLILLFDSIEKVALCTQRKELMHKITKPIWVWYDQSTSKWSAYSSSNQKLINEAYWTNEASVRVTCGRRRYTLSFANMDQVNDESGFHRPISMTLLNLLTIKERTEESEDMELDEEKDSEEVGEEEEEVEDEEQQLTSTSQNESNAESIQTSSDLTKFVKRKMRQRHIAVKGIPDRFINLIVSVCVKLIKPGICGDILQAILRLCLRLTRDFKCAKIFAEEGGIKKMLQLTQQSNFVGSISLSTLIIRHVLEEPQTLCLAMEKVIRGKALNSIPPSHKEIHYLLRQISSAVCRSPELFFEVAKRCLRIDVGVLNRRSNDDEDKRLLVRCEPPTRSPAQPMNEDVSIQVIYDLLNILVEPAAEIFNTNNTETSNDKSITSNSKCTQRALNESSSAPHSEALSILNDDLPINIQKPRKEIASSSSPSRNTENNDKKVNPFISKQVVLKLLGEAVRSYGAIAKLITEFTYKAGQSLLITEDCSALAFLLDKMLPPIPEVSSDSQCSVMVRMLVAAIASCNHSPESQSILVQEIKSALCRALVMPESNEKHVQIQLLSGLVSTMIENCPPTQGATPFRGIRLQNTSNANPNSVNNIVKIMIRKNLVQDLSRIPHFLDLSSPNMAATVNAFLKPLETLSRIVNQPMNMLNQPKFMKSKSTARGTQSGTTSTEVTNAQGEEVAEDTENTEHDISAAGESLEPHSEVQHQEDGEVAALEEIMDQLLERETQATTRSYSEVTAGRVHAMDVDEEPGEIRNLVYDTERDVTEELMSTDSGDSDSNPSDQEVEDEDNDDEVDDEDMDEGEENEGNNYDEVEENNSGLGFFDNENPGIFRITTHERDEEVLMIYSDSDHDENISRMVHWNPSNGFQLPFGLFEENSSSNDLMTIPPTHPLLMSRHNSDGNSVPRNQRTNRQRRYQYLQINPRSTNPPVILQRLLGPASNNIPGTVIAGSVIGEPPSLRVSNRVFLMENGFGMFNHAEDPTDFVDQSGYLFGPSLAATLSHVPTALHWWNEEAKILDGDSEANCCAIVAHRLIPILEHYRDLELSEKKRKRQEDEDSTEYKHSVSKNESMETENRPAEGQTSTLVGSSNDDSPPFDTGVLAESVADSVLRPNPSPLSDEHNRNSVDILADRIIDSIIHPTINPGEDMRHPTNYPPHDHIPEYRQRLMRTNLRPRYIINPAEFENRQETSTSTQVSRGVGDTAFAGSNSSLNRVYPQPVNFIQNGHVWEFADTLSNTSTTTASTSTSTHQRPLTATSTNTNTAVTQAPDADLNFGLMVDMNVEQETIREGLSDSSSDMPMFDTRVRTNPMFEIVNVRGNLEEDDVTRLNVPTVVPPPDIHEGDDEVVNLRPPLPLDQSQSTINLRVNLHFNEMSQTNDRNNTTASIRRGSSSSSSGNDRLIPIRERPYDPNYDSPSSTESQDNDDINSFRLEDNEIIEILSAQEYTPSSRRLSNMQLLDDDDDMSSDQGRLISNQTRSRNNFDRMRSTDEFSNDSDNAGTSESQSDVTPRASQMSTPLASHITEASIIFSSSRLDEPQATSSSFTNIPTATTSSQGSSQTGNVTVSMDSNGSSSTDPLMDIPEGVDPSFLEALPEDVRREVIAEQRRLMRLQQRAQANATTSGEAGATGSTEVSPEFLAALPPALQEEVLAQQRLEQQRQAAASANPDDPVDAAAFFQNLQPSLRQAILTDIEESQISVLPPDLAAEAQNLRRDWEARNRQMMQERFLNQLHSNTTLSSILRHGNRGNRLSTRYAIHTVPQRCTWNSWNRGESGNSSGSSVGTNFGMRIRGRQLLDHESLSCLLVLLFADEPKFNTLRLHRVIRNLCYHAPTRDWIVRALLSIINRSVNSKFDLSNDIQNLKMNKRSTKSVNTDSRSQINNSTWLNIKMDAALGCRANVFLVQKNSGKRTDRQTISSVTVHPQAAPVVCRHALDLFISLAKSFPTVFIPLKRQKDEEKERDDKKDALFEFKNGKLSHVSPGKKSSYSEPQTDFWDILLKLDTLSSTKKGKNITKLHNNTNTSFEADNTVTTFEMSTFGQLLGMLSSPVITRSPQLTDKLLRLLSLITFGLAELPIYLPSNKFSGKMKNPKIDSISAFEESLRSVISVITTKCCSEEGLEDAATLLFNISHSSDEMRNVVLWSMMAGGLTLANEITMQIGNLLKELKSTNVSQIMISGDEGVSNIERPSKGLICDRFTKETVVITASAKVKQSCDLQLPSMAPLTTKTSSQAFFLRLLRLIAQVHEGLRKSYIQDSEKAKTLDAETQAKDKEKIWNQYGLVADVDGKIPNLSEMLSLGLLWNTLSQCLLELEHTPDHHAVLVLQPTVEAFFLIHSPSKNSSDSANRESEQVEPPEDPLSHLNYPATEIVKAPINIPVDQQKFLFFAEKHRTVLNQILRQTSAHLADGPFSVLVDHTRILDFDVKRKYFRTELERLDNGIRREETAVHVRRSHIFEDSFRELYRRPSEEWKNRFYIVFEDEEGQDAGGLLREWYMIISRDIFNPMYALFTISPGDRVTYMINSSSHCNPNHLCYYKFVGRVIAKAIYDNKLLECYFTRSFYKHILGIQVKHTDMESEDYSLYKGLKYLTENRVEDVGYELTFSTEMNEFGTTQIRDLLPNGQNVPVTEENKMEYIRLLCHMKMTGAIKQQLKAFLEGFYDIIPKRLISIFNEQELELLISGLPNVDIEDLKSNTEYHKYQSNSLQIQWFWRALRSFNQAERAKFLQFVTGTSKVPLQGFAALEGMNGTQKFQIHRDDRSTDRLPSAHTCFNQLDLPVYETYDKLRSYLLKAIHECSEGFGFA